MTSDQPERDVTPKDFEDALKTLEAIVRELEDGDLSLENSLARYEHGVQLARFCNRKLEEAEKRIEVLQTRDDGEPVGRTPLELDE